MYIYICKCTHIFVYTNMYMYIIYIYIIQTINEFHMGLFLQYRTLCLSMLWPYIPSYWRRLAYVDPKVLTFQTSVRPHVYIIELQGEPLGLLSRPLKGICWGPAPSVHLLSQLSLLGLTRARTSKPSNSFARTNGPHQDPYTPSQDLDNPQQASLFLIWSSGVYGWGQYGTHEGS